MSHRIPGFIEKAGKAGVARVFIGLENINPENLKSAGKGQNKIAEYRRMLQAWRSVRAITCAGYILGFPGDTRESIVRDIKTIQRELPVDLLEFFLLTPLPGSEDHRGLAESGVWMDPDMNNYDLNHVTTKHPIMTSKEWKRAYHAAWDTYYTPKHIETVLKRTKANNMGIRKTMFILLWFYSCMRYEGVHPLEGGHFRRKYRLDRRPGLPIESPIIFYPKRLWQMAFRQIKILPRLFRCFLMIRRIKSDPDAANYTDEALMPVSTESDNPNEYECDPEQMRQSN